MLTLDHLVVSATGLTTGTAQIEELLGVGLEPGGQHGFMGTHNTLLSLGPSAYLEVISIDPNAPTPDRPRWFGLDQFSGSARLTNWVCRSDDIERDLAAAPDEMAELFDAERGDLRWKMALTSGGQYPFGGAFPGMIEWQGSAHPADRLPDRGIRLVSLTLHHPQADDLRLALTRLSDDVPVSIVQSAQAGLVATLRTPVGEVQLR
jgi:hypothetical protein